MDIIANRCDCVVAMSMPAAVVVASLTLYYIFKDVLFSTKKLMTAAVFKFRSRIHTQNRYKNATTKNACIEDGTNGNEMSKCDVEKS